MSPSSRFFILLYNVLWKWGLCRLTIHSFNYYPSFPGNFSTPWTISVKSRTTVEVTKMSKTFDHQIQLRLYEAEWTIDTFANYVSLLTKNNSRSRQEVGHCKGFLIPVCPGSGKDRINCCSTQEGHRQDPEVILYHLTWFPGAGEGVPSGSLT